MTTKTLAEMTAEVREINIEKGWRAPDGPLPGQTFGDRIALLHSEVSEALEAFRDHELADPTMPHCDKPECPRYGKVASAELCTRQTDGTWHSTVPGKPEGVGSELADVLIRLLDMADVFGVRLSGYDHLHELRAHAPSIRIGEVTTFGDHIAWLHREISDVLVSTIRLPVVLRTLVTITQKYGIDLTAEYERKVAFNRTRSFRHGGRAL